MKFRISDHAKAECERREITLAVLQGVLERPGQVVSEQRGRKAYQSKITFADKVYLVRAIVDENESPAVVITVYRTSKIEKYWSKQ
jgi:hypothetical protein